MASPSRARIIDAALELMSERGVAGASMRRLAGACDLNVATLYHHFPSKADVFRAVVQERGFAERFRTEGPPSLSARTPATRLTELLVWFWRQAAEEEAVWRLLIGESLRGERIARTTSTELVAMLEQAAERSVAARIPELTDRAPAVARSVVGLMFALIVEHLALGADEARARRRIADLVDLVV
jgi:TetR/AcrR family transcriptional repressor of uid operon